MTKPTHDTLAIVGILLTAAGTVSSFSTPPNSFGSRLGLSNSTLLNFGKALFVIGAGLIVWRIMYWIINAIKPKDCKLGLQAAKKADMKELHALYEAHFGQDAPDLTQMRKWHKRNPRIFQIIVRLDPVTRNRKIVASFKAIPLKDLAIAHLEMEHITGSTLTEDYIVKPRGKASAWYLGDLVSSSPASARAVMKELRNYFLSTRAPYLSIYARPLTLNGLHYMRKFHFEPVGDGTMQIGQICHLMAADIPKVVNELLSHPSAGKAKAPKRAESRPANVNDDLVAG